MVDLFKNDFVAVSALVQISGGVLLRPHFRKRFPNGRSALFYRPDDGFAARQLRGLGNLVIGIVRKKGVFGIFSTGRQSAVARNEHPVVGVTHDTHKKRPHGIAICDFIIGFAVDHFSGKANLGSFRHCYIAYHPSDSIVFLKK